MVRLAHNIISTQIKSNRIVSLISDSISMDQLCALSIHRIRNYLLSLQIKQPLAWTPTFCDCQPVKKHNQKINEWVVKTIQHCEKLVRNSKIVILLQIRKQKSFSCYITSQTSDWAHRELYCCIQLCCSSIWNLKLVLSKLNYFEYNWTRLLWPLFWFFKYVMLANYIQRRKAWFCIESLRIIESYSICS